ncbi:XdhC family protein [Antribacter gilvus]|uniref:XdhC family protein n=1 Tax=Antribacter gilvus TaxID=2304675 RepID=UPI000F7B782E|nr:XdhC/CoxI family protein [Antribacter gilvus]
MRDLLPSLLAWWHAGERGALATVVRTFSSAPRTAGAAMAVGPGGDVVGSVSGGCVEGAVYDLCLEVSETGVPALARYGVSDASALDVGLTCGGTIEVLVTPFSRETWPGFPALVADLLPDDGRVASPVALATVVAAPAAGSVGQRLTVRTGVGRGRGGGSDTEGSLGDPALDAVVAEDAVGHLAAGETALREYGPRGERLGTGVRVLVQSFAPPPRLLVFGAIDFAAAMCRAGRLLGYRVTVCDARPIFATAARFPDADEVVVDWPHRYLEAELAAGRVDGSTAVCVLTHDPKFDVPLLRAALSGLPDDAYVGAMGSRRTHDDRVARLLEEGVPQAALARLRSPIGLDLGARTPDETAISIAAEIVAARTGASARPLSETRGRIHGDD